MKKKPVLFVCLLSLGLGLGGLVMPVGCGGVDSKEPKTEVTPSDASNNPDTAITPDTATTPDKATPTDSTPVDTATPPDKADTPDTTTVVDAAPDTATTPDTGTTPDTAPDAGGTDTGTTDTGTTGISYAKDIDAIFQRNNCMSGYCHGGGTKSGGFGFGTDGYGNLVNQKSTSGAWTRVVPNDPAKSLLYEKLSKETPAEGGRMPQGNKLTQDEIDMVRDWIQQGAKP